MNNLLQTIKHCVMTPLWVFCEKGGRYKIIVIHNIALSDIEFYDNKYYSTDIFYDGMFKHLR